MPRLRPHLIAIAALVVCGLLLHSDFASQRFYSDDFLFLRNSRDWELREFLRGLFSSPANSDWAYWRPGLRLSLAAMYSVFGLTDSAYMAVGLGLHICAAIMVYALVWTTTRSSWFGVLAGLWVLSAPATVEAITWVVCSFGVLPASLALFASGWCFIASLDSERRGLYTAAIALSCVSLTFREPAYQMPFVVFGASWLYDRAVVRALLKSLPFVALTAFHYLVLNEVSSEGAGLLDLLWRSLENEAGLIRKVFGIGGSDALVLSVFLAVCALGMWFGDWRGRAVIWWMLFACLPYIAKTATARHTYVLHLCFATAVALVLAQLVRSRPRGRVVALGVMAALSVLNVLRLPHAQQFQRSMGAQSASVLDWSREQDLGRFDLLMPDFVPMAIENGWSAMLSLYLGLDVEVYPNNSLPRPPFQIVFQDVFVGDAKVGYLHFDRPTARYSLVPKTAMFGDRIVVPILSVVDRYEVVEPQAALMRVVSGAVDLRKTVLIDKGPSRAFEPTGGSHVISSFGWPRVEIDVDAKGPCYLVICLPVRLEAGGKTVTVDGEVVSPVTANGVFDAVWLGAGRHTVVVQ